MLDKFAGTISSPVSPASIGPESSIHDIRPVCYLIHFERPYLAKTGKQQHKVQHYLGWTINLEKRVKLHATGQGARLLAVVNTEGIGWSVVRLWENGSYALERKLKARHGYSTYCPICNQRHKDLLPAELLGTLATRVDHTGEQTKNENPQGPGESLVLSLLEGQAR